MLPVTPVMIIWLVDIPWLLHTYCSTFGLSFTLLVLNIYNEKFQEKYIQCILCLISKCIKSGQGDSWGGHQKHHWEGKTSTLMPPGSWIPIQPPGGSSPSLAQGRQWALLTKVSGGGSVGSSPGHGEQWWVSLGHKVSPTVSVAVVPEVLDAPGFGCMESQSHMSDFLRDWQNVFQRSVPFHISISSVWKSQFLLLLTNTKSFSFDSNRWAVVSNWGFNLHCHND